MRAEVRRISDVLIGDWVTFDFDYRLDIQSLIPHIVAIEEYKEAALTRVLPPHWLQLSANPNSGPAVDETAVPEDKPLSGATGSRPQGLPAGQEPQEDQTAGAQKRLPIRDTSAARAWVKERFVPGSAPMSLADILTIHKMVADQSGIESGSAGALRTMGVRVGRTEVGGIHWGAPAEHLPTLMERYVGFINSDRLCSLPPAIHALLAHYFFDTIHPFLDGNGRTSRLLAAAILFQYGYNVHGSYALVTYFYRHDLRYHRILQRSWKCCPFDVTPFVAFGMEGFVTELKSVASFIKMKLDRIVDREMSAPAFRRRLGARSRALN